jgi:CP family cyanate transporter-like MFS transporter
LGFILSSVNSTYFCSNAFLPAHLSSADRADLISPALTALNFGQLPASILLLAMAARLEARVWPYVGFGLGALGSICGIIFSASHWTVTWAGLLGFCCGAQLTLGLALAPLLCKPQDVPRVSAAMFTISYMLSVLVSIISGAIWDWTGMARASFFAVAVSALPIIILTPGLPFPRRHAFRSRVQE